MRLMDFGCYFHLGSFPTTFQTHKESRIILEYEYAILARQSTVTRNIFAVTEYATISHQGTNTLATEENSKQPDGRWGMDCVRERTMCIRDILRMDLCKKNNSVLFTEVCQH